MRFSDVKALYEDCGRGPVSEPLTQHLRGVGDILAGAGGAVLGRYFRVRHGLGEDFIHYLALAGYLHDIGKAVIRSVRRDRSSGCVVYSFRGHEAVSAFVVARLMRGVDVSDELLEAAPVFAVLYHHHAMGTERRISIEDMKWVRPQVGSAAELAELIAESIKPLPRSIRSGLEAAAPDAADAVMGDLGRVTAYVRRNLDDWVWRVAAGKEGGFAVLTASAAALVAADYVTAANARKAPRSGFSAAALEFARHYLGVGDP